MQKWPGASLPAAHAGAGSFSHCCGYLATPGTRGASTLEWKFHTTSNTGTELRQKQPQSTGRGIGTSSTAHQYMRNRNTSLEDNWVSLLDCQWKAHSGRTSLNFVPASIEDNFLRGAQTALASADSTITLMSSTSASASAPASPSPTSSSSNIPTTVGGAVGGLVAVVIGVCVVAWLLIREKRASRAQDALSPSQGLTQSAQFSTLPEVSVPENHLPLYPGAEERHKYQSVSAAPPSVLSEALLASSPSPRRTINVNDTPVELE
ncbi:hypothetical protein BDP67DRAFT_484796 [Colletotrichum lupini]|nr:hypothetical protein BDP67DRAFT_484796 [Colletotrichum lupini]